MKKLTYLASAVLAGFSANAVADVTVSGSGSVGYVNDTTGDGNISIGSAVNFGLSTTTANGITISSGLSMTVTAEGAGTATAGGGESMTFSTGGATLVVGDMSVADNPGSVAGVVSGTTGDNSGLNSDVKSEFQDDDGFGISLATSAAGAAVSVAYVFDDDDNASFVNTTDSAPSALSAGVSVPMGDFTVAAGIADHDDGESSSGASISAAIGAGTLKIGYTSLTLNAQASADKTTGFTTSVDNSLSGNVTTASTGNLAITYEAGGLSAATVLQVTDLTSVATLANTSNGADLQNAGDTTVWSAAYSMALDADTTFATSYKQAKDADGDSENVFEVSISRSLGGGASVYVDMKSLTGDADVDGTAFGFGTSVSF
jgi:hypothetical protein